MARFGFWDATTAAAAAERLALDEGTLAALSAAADPDLALRTLERLVEVAGRAPLDGLVAESGLRRRLIAVLGASAALGDHLVAHPDDWQLLREDDVIPTLGSPGTADELRLAHRRALLVLAGGDLSGALELWDVADILADLAGSALQHALDLARAELGPKGEGARLAVIAMGKCGGQELNYVSDVDVVFVGEPAEGDPDGLVSATRLAEGLIKICSSASAESAMFPVDANLRPEGRQGPLVRTLASHEAYYKRWARTWEYQALLKARPVAGDADLGQQYADMIAPMVWSAASRPNFVADVQAMRRRVEENIPRPELERQVKLGPGGLRDIEFAVQLLQMVHGRTDGRVHSRSTLPALEQLTDNGYIGRMDSSTLADSYVFLRNLEHRLQLQRLRRTHVVPTNPDDLRWLARAMGFRDVDRFEAERARHVREVRRLHEKLFYRPLLDAVARLPADSARFNTRLTPKAAQARLQALGFQDPAGALKHLQALSIGLSRTATIQRVLLPAMLDAFADAADPDAGLKAYRQVSDALGRTPWYLRLLRDEGTGGGAGGGGAAERLARLLASSPYVADLMTRAPESVRLLRSLDELRPRSREQVATALLSVVRRNTDWEDAVAAARAVRRLELVRVACADLLGLLDIVEVGEALSDAAAATLAAALDVASRKVEVEMRGPLPAAIAVIAMGRLGGNEMGYGSDADVMFVYETRPEAEEADAARAAKAVAEEMRRLLALPAPDPPLLLDVALRPEGRQGPLARSLGSYAAYYQRWSIGWEAQALLRAMPLAGDVELGMRFSELADTVRYPATLASAAVAEVARLKRRMEQERVSRSVDRTLHLKLGPGGLTDVEWTVQLLQLQHGAASPELRTASTLDALAAAAAAGLISTEEAEVLAEGWRSAARLRNAVVLTTGKALDVLPTGERASGRVAEVLGYSADEGGRLLEDHRARGRRVREVVDEVFRRCAEFAEAAEHGDADEHRDADEHGNADEHDAATTDERGAG
jgi:[glutamine synthetase] adenylyltransferase / [glutamine synthetase]-adenylyl-L-tyrosine phosphorylase